jgi:hypothetical protein
MTTLPSEWVHLAFQRDLNEQGDRGKGETDGLASNRSHAQTAA